MKYFTALSILWIVFVQGQTLTFPNGFSMKSDPYKARSFEKSIYNIYYQLSFSNNPLNPESKRETMCLLQVGDKYSKFTDYKAIQKDSLYEKYSHQDAVNGKEMNELLKFREVWSAMVLKKTIEKVIIVQDKAKNTYEYEEQQPTFKWELYDGAKKILNYNCKKAITKFRGRIYTAWYTNEIPINNGPYVFEGLPGLILQIEDDKKQFSFTAVGLDKKPSMIYQREENKIFKVTREKFRQVQKAYYDNPGFFHGNAYGEDGTVISGGSKAIPYNPIDLE